MGLWFFFSYARLDRDERLDRFYQDLARDVGRTKQLSNEETSFFDQRSIEVGDIWDAKLREALRTTRVLVAICSPPYMSREYCGKELQACIERVSAGAKSTAIFPVIWGDPRRSQHGAFSKYQFTHDDLTEVYKNEGLEYMMRLSKHADDYQQFVTKLARMIVAAGESHPLKETASLPSFERLINPFAKPMARTAKTLKHAMFAFVAARRDELATEVADRYGDDGKEWRPFHPDSSDPVGVMALEATAKQKLFYKDLPLDGELVKRIEEAEANKEVVIIVVDPLSIQVKTYADYMRSYDKRNFENSAVLVAWNTKADGADADRQKLRKQLSATFKYRAQGAKSIYYVDSISSPRDFRRSLENTIVKLRNNMIQSSETSQPIDDPDLQRRAAGQGIETGTQPIVAGPGDRT